VKFVDPILIERFRHAGPGLDKDDLLLATDDGREREQPSESQRQELA
jgi:hypothetical protein